MTRARFIRVASATTVAIVSLAALLAGVGLWVTGHGPAQSILWAALVAVLLVPLGWSVVRTLLRGDVGVDAIALILDGRRARAPGVSGRVR